MEKKTYVSQEQKKQLIDIITNDADMMSGKFSSTFTFKECQARWENISNILNAIPGANKDWRHWRKTWQDIRTKIKSKSIQIKKHAHGTGGGPSYVKGITDCEAQVLASIDIQVLDGNKTEESEVEFMFPDETVHVKEKENIPYTSGTPTRTVEPKQKSSSSNKTRNISARRLQSSTTATTVLADVSSKDVELRKQYYKKKLELMERQVEALEKIGEALKSKNEK